MCVSARYGSRSISNGRPQIIWPSIIPAALARSPSQPAGNPSALNWASGRQAVTPLPLTSEKSFLKPWTGLAPWMVEIDSTAVAEAAS